MLLATISYLRDSFETHPAIGLGSLLLLDVVLNALVLLTR